jgi:hypothetical protein
MLMVGLALLGSRARGDHGEDADVDLLGVETGPPARTVVYGRCTLSCYPLDDILRHARSGDLFALHIASEAKVIYEARPVFEHIKRAFTYRPDYSREIRLASDVGWFLVRYCDRFRSGKVLNEKVAWCTRTMLIAEAAAQRRPIFSAAALSEFAGSGAVRTLIEHKDSAELDFGMMETFRGVLRTFGAAEPPMLRTLAEQKCAFETDGNAPGVRAISAMTKS